jgi:hypothetical protein
MRRKLSLGLPFLTDRNLDRQQAQIVAAYRVREFPTEKTGIILFFLANRSSRWHNRSKAPHVPVWSDQNIFLLGAAVEKASNCQDGYA